jgi:ribosomal protein L22
MTKAEYQKAYRQVRKDGPKIAAKAMTEIRRTYKEAGDLVAEQIRQSTLADASSLTTESLAAIQSELVKAAEMVRDSVEETIPKAVATISSRVSSIDEEYIMSASKSAQAGFSAVKIHNMVVAVNREVVENITRRIWEDGYTFSTRIWRIGEGFQDDIKRVLTAGLAQGRDPIKIAADLEKYIDGGKQVLMKRYGQLKAGTARFARRIPQNVDYRAMRLVRSELYAGLKEADVLAGKMNPGALDEFDWIMNAGRADWDCDCPSYARNSPYKASEVPSQPHPNCMCYILPRLRDRREFVDDLVKWSNGEAVPYLDRWEGEYYNNA